MILYLMEEKKHRVLVSHEHYVLLRAIAKARNVSVEFLLSGWIDATLEGMQISDVEDVSQIDGTAINWNL